MIYMIVYSIAVIMLSIGVTMLSRRRPAYAVVRRAELGRPGAGSRMCAYRTVPHSSSVDHSRCRVVHNSRTRGFQWKHVGRRIPCLGCSGPCPRPRHLRPLRRVVADAALYGFTR